MRMRDVFIYDHVRTPRGRGKPNGGLHEVRPVDLSTQLLAALKKRNDLPADSVDEVILGCVSPAGEQGATLMRVAPILAGFADSTPGLHLDRACASGLEAVSIATGKIGMGMADLAICGGVESMSRIPMGGNGGGPQGTDPIVTSQFPMLPTGLCADLIATLYGYTRTDLDAYGVESHLRADRAWKEGRFANSVVPIVDNLGGELLAKDETIRPDASMQSFGALKPTFEGEKLGFSKVAIQRYPQIDRIEYLHTPGTSSGIVDGASSMLVGSGDAGAKLGLKPRAKIRSFVSVGSEPVIMLEGPTTACQKALKIAGMEVSDIDLWELNEAFAIVPIRLMENLKIPHDKMNVNGGAIAMGHPLGATGAMILGTVLDELERSDKETALITLCVGAGMGTATVIERV
jgi:acetyl-CoA C-acetyltransferase